MELNPNNKVARQAHGNWHKIAAMIMVKLDLKELRFGMDDINKMAGGNVNIVLDGTEEKETGELVIRIVDDKEADRLVRKEGGRACDS